MLRGGTTFSGFDCPTRPDGRAADAADGGSSAWMRDFWRSEVAAMPPPRAVSTIAARRVPDGVVCSVPAHSPVAFFPLYCHCHSDPSRTFQKSPRVVPHPRRRRRCSSCPSQLSPSQRDHPLPPFVASAAYLSARARIGRRRERALQSPRRHHQ